jgi:hypothetical protein
MNTGKAVWYTIVGLVLVGGGYLAYQQFAWNKKRALGYLRRARSWDDTTTTNASKFDEGYLVAWAKSHKKGSESFEYQGKTYNSVSGKAL